jgi:hypothetical protein
MSSLTSQQINDTYAGLLKLADSTTGITDNFQYIQDGLGNNLPLQVKNGQIQGQNLFSFGYFVPDYEGVGFTSTGAQFPNNSQNVLISNPFYNPGLHSYSAITYRVITATTTSDTAELSFYSTQFVNGYGLQPKDLVLSGITLEVGSTGIKTTALPSTMSFSGFGSGIYFAVMKVSNSGVQPTIRFASDTGLGTQLVNAQQLGVQFDATGQVMLSPSKQSGTGAFRNSIIYNSLSTYKTSFDAADFSGGVLNATYNGFGFALNVIK